MAEGEEEPRAERPFLVSHELARGVVDRGDMIGVECVPGTERPEACEPPRALGPGPGSGRGAGSRRTRSSPPQPVERGDDQRHTAAACPIPPG